jgi:hypothetical protein
MQLFLYPADELQMLANGKPMVSGLYSDRVIVCNLAEGAPLPSSEEPLLLERMCFLVCVADLPVGDLELAFYLEQLGGEPLPYELPTAKVSVPEPGGSANYQMRFAPFVVPAFGRYRFRVSEAQTRSEATAEFEVRLKRVAVAKAPQTPAGVWQAD